MWSLQCLALFLSTAAEVAEETEGLPVPIYSQEANPAAAPLLHPMSCVWEVTRELWSRE